MRQIPEGVDAGPGAPGGWQSAVRGALTLLIMSALLTAFSEGFYWYSGGTDFPARVLFYLIPTTAFAWMITRWPAPTWSSVLLAGAVYGFITEGVLTAVVYGGFPFDPFAISYTSLAWHALISVGFGLVLLHRVLARGSAVRAVSLIGLFGVFWGIWAISLRLPPEPDDELPALAALVGDVSVSTFAVYTLAMTVVVGLCHLYLGRIATPADCAPRRTWAWLVLAAGALWFAILTVPSAPWALVELPVLLAIGLWGAARITRNAPREMSSPSRAGVATLVCEPIPVGRLGRLAALPVAATATYALLVWLGPDDDTIRLFARDTVVGLQMVAGWVAFILALRHAVTLGRRTGDVGP